MINIIGRMRFKNVGYSERRKKKFEMKKENITIPLAKFVMHLILLEGIRSQFPCKHYCSSLFILVNFNDHDLYYLSYLITHCK